MKRISLVVPCYNEEEALPLFYRAADEVARSMPEQVFEFLFVDDGSTDKTLALLREYRAKDERVRYLSFSRNFGKEAALYAGLEASTGDYVAVMDADMQDPPSLLPEMYALVRSGEFDCAATRRVSRAGEPPVRSFCARMFYALIRHISSTEIVDGARDFRLMTRQMTDAVLQMGEYNRFSKGIFGWVGFRTKWLEYENVQRAAGQTKWSFWKLFIYSLEGITAFSTAPLAMAAVLGIVFCAVSFLAVCAIVVRTLVWGDPVSGWPSLACIMFFVGGVQLLCTGIVGQYLAKTYLETKRRPLYLIKERET